MPLASEFFNKWADWKGAFIRPWREIAAGANPAAVKRRLPRHGIDPSGL
jgi:hypothetical protein